MDSNLLLISLLVGGSLFSFIIFFASYAYDKEMMNTQTVKKDPEEWLFHNFYLKTYNALYGYQNPEEVAIKLGIKVEDYYRYCDITRTDPNVKKLVMYYIYGFVCLIVSLILTLFVSPYCILVGGILFYGLSFMEISNLKSKAESMRIQVGDDLPRFLDLLKTELVIGLPVETAIEILCKKFDSLLSTELLEALNKSELGAQGWQEALEDVASKYDIETLSDFVLDITTSYSKGVDVSMSVTRKAAEIKDTHLLNIKERAGKTTNTILIPIAIFQFIPLIVFLMFPAIIQVFSGF